ncbi:hypothetical protein HanPI659440_Chr09g0321051 [Helianthus annuus]|nr:hypothetical protein HanPI659440_Chr09g0321051 [Helianthus annuus]
MIDNYFSLIKYIWITKSLTHRYCSSLTCISDWMRIGAFSFDSPDAFLMENLICPPKLPTDDTVQKMLDSGGSCILHNIKTGIWIAGTTQVLDARHLELFLNDGFVNGSWEYELVGSHDIKRHVNSASGGILDIKRFNSPYTADLFNLKPWVGKSNDWQPKATVTYNSVAINTNLQDNDGKIPFKSLIVTRCSV